MMASVVANGNRTKSLSLKGVDPETCMIVFRNHWAQVVKILEKHDPVHNSGGVCLRLGPIPGDEASAVQNYVEHMLLLLMEEEPGQGGAMGAILELVVVEGVMERLFLWSLRRHFTDDMKLEQLRMYQMLLSQARQPLLHHKPVLRPLMMLLSSCAGAGAGGRGGGGGSVEAELVLLLNQLCGALAKDPSVLELFFHTSEDQGAANFLLFSLLIPFTHQEGSVGQQARDALLLIMKLSAYNPRVATHITDNTYFCPVLATGLSGLYSSLPAKLQVYSEDWHCLERADWIQVPALVQFLNSLQFCCSVIKVGHPSIRGQLLGYIYNGFLVPVLAPALHKCTLEEVMTTTAYLDLFLRSVSEPALLQTFLSFILLHTHDNVQLLDTLVSRVNTPFQLGTVSLALFRTLIGLFCEDVMLQLILRYLIPCTHLCVRERRSLKDRDTYSSSAVNLLFLTPSWCPLRLGAVNTHTQHIHWALGTDVPVSEGDSVGYSRICRTDFLMNVNYLQYLWDARVGIAASLQACLVWSGPYDGVNPVPREEEDGEEEREEEKTDRTGPPLTSPPVTMGNQHRGGDGGRGSVVELEWDDSYEWDDSALPPSSLPPTSSSPTPPVHMETPQHIQEMRRSAIMLIQGSYVEESDFQDDVLAYNLVAQKDAARSREVDYKPDRRTTPQTSTPAVRSTTSTALAHRHGTHRREKEGVREEEGLREENVSQPHQLSNGLSCEDHTVNKEVDDDRKRTPSGPHLDHNCNMTVTTTVTNDLNAAEHQERTTSENHIHPVLNGLPDVEKQQDWNKTDADHPLTPITTSAVGDNFLSQYRELMRSLGAEPDDVTDDITAFRKRVLALAQEEEEEEEDEEDFSVFSTDSPEPKDADLEPENSPGLTRNSQDRKHGIPFTGPFISVLLSRLENLLENPIPVNLLVTGILSQLAKYPQPLLRAFLLNTHTDPQPNVRTLYQVLVSVRVQIEQYAVDQTEFPATVREAWRYLLARDQALKLRELLQDSHSEYRKSVLPNGTQQITQNVPPCPNIPPQARNRVFATVLYAEFLKELAAIAQEHSIVPDSPIED
ncbi:FHF complex subunit HOOK interacting protein 1A-like [Salvelinus fontinalis]|uniref:FHF complex subunit HOOK interacting protein 1A-like n=1 Tax=Salvelinus fontinalis TaxID=8038 RepID=UPI0024854917|nr:FHF complex subunit HOOK interacting protein 1A-like [Salvelinus fontinalis]